MVSSTYVISVNHESGLYSVAIENGERSTYQEQVAFVPYQIHHVPRLTTQSAFHLHFSKYSLRVESYFTNHFRSYSKKEQRIVSFWMRKKFLTLRLKFLNQHFPSVFVRIRKCKKRFQKSLFDSFGIASGQIDRKQFLSSLECKPQRFDRSVLTDFNVLRSSLWSIPYVICRIAVEIKH